VTRVASLISILWLCLWPAAVGAHVMQVPYNLPVPFWLYAYGATGALLASFLVVGYFVRADAAHAAFRSVDVSRAGFVALITRPAVIGTFRALSVLLLLLTIASGFLGTKIPARNFNITFFWVIFSLGFMYLIAFVGDFYRAVNPWLVLCEWIERIKPDFFRVRLAYPQWLAYYPALVLYMAFIWIELFGRTAPLALSWILLVYTGVNLVAALLVGKDMWFRHGEIFAVLFRLVGKMAPLEYRCGDSAPDAHSVRLPPRGQEASLGTARREAAPNAHSVPEVHARPPFVGLLRERADHFSLLLFVLFMLSSTAYDGIHETVPWVTIFWKHLYPVLAAFIATDNPRQYLVLVDYFYRWQWLMMLVSPFIYLAIYMAFIWLAKAISRSPLSVRELALQFAFSLIPIAFVYNVTHYFTLLVSQGPFIWPLISDPLGFGWNLFGTKGTYIQPFLLDAGVIWHTQVGLILFGHIVSVYLAHVEALKVFPTNRQATLSQLPLLLLMVFLTTIGLWILSLPIAAGQVLLPPASPGG
jgi:hypothetical protein